MNSRHTAAGRRRGFTILELLIVITMVGALAAISLGRSSRIMDGWRVTRAAQAFAEELQQGFAIVGRNRKPVIMQMDTLTMNFVIKDRAGVVFRTRHFGKDSEYKLRKTDISANRMILEVYPPGLAADSLSLVINRPGKSRRIRMLRGGLVQICASGVKTKCD